MWKWLFSCQQLPHNQPEAIHIDGKWVLSGALENLGCHCFEIRKRFLNKTWECTVLWRAAHLGHDLICFVMVVFEFSYPQISNLYNDICFWIEGENLKSPLLISRLRGILFKRTKKFSGLRSRCSTFFECRNSIAHAISFAIRNRKAKESGSHSVWIRSDTVPCLASSMIRYTLGGSAQPAKKWMTFGCAISLLTQHQQQRIEKTYH